MRRKRSRRDCWAGSLARFSLLFAIRQGVEFRALAAGVDEDVILIDHGIDPDRLIGREVLASQMRIFVLRKDGIGSHRLTLAPGAGKATTRKGVVGAGDE